jgi:hypothetical protein
MTAIWKDRKIPFEILLPSDLELIPEISLNINYKSKYLNLHSLHV